jgi:hypothetical protein
MDERSIALYLSRKGLLAKEIHQDYVQTPSVEAAAYPTGTWDIRAAKCPLKVSRSLMRRE